MVLVVGVEEGETLGQVEGNIVARDVIVKFGQESVKVMRLQ